jgi:hypothetical protein
MFAIPKYVKFYRCIKFNNLHFNFIIEALKYIRFNFVFLKVQGTAVVVEGKHEERADDHGYISRHFVRRYVLPEHYNMEQLNSSLSSDGVLTISAPKKVPESFLSLLAHRIYVGDSL